MDVDLATVYLGAIMTPSKVNDVIHVLELARDEATKSQPPATGAHRSSNVVRAIRRKHD